MKRGRPRIILAPCKYCGRQFKRAEHLQRHERVHTREKPFSCDCGETFSRQDLLTRHQRIAHAQEVSIGNDELGVVVKDQPNPLHLPQVTLGSNVSGHGPAGDIHGSSASPNIMCSSSLVMDNHLQQEQATDNQPLAVPNFISAFGGFDERDFLWDNFLADGQLVPVNFFDTEFDLVGMSQEVACYPFVDLLQPSIPESATNQRARASASSSQEMHTECLNIRLPSLEPDIQPPKSTNMPKTMSSSAFRQFSTATPPWKISSDEYQKISQALTEVCHELPQAFSIPSQHTLSRYLEGHFRGFYDHLPCLHMANFSAAALGPELLLSLAAAGAFYRFERSKANDLYRFAKAAIDRRLDEWNDESLARASASPPEPPLPISHRGHAGLRVLQAIVVLMAIASWSDGSLKRDMISLSGEAAVLVREFGISSPEEPPKATWEAWIMAEERRRTLFAAYSLFNLECIAFNVPPLILNQEVCLNMPSCANAWNASSAAEWAEARSRTVLSFQDVLRKLLSGIPVHQKQLISAFGNYVLILGLFQQVFFARLGAGCLADPQGPSGPEFVKSMETALLLWQQSWEATYESTLDPASPKGPMGFNSTALLRLVHIRLNANTGPLRQLVAHDPSSAASVFMDGQGGALERSPRLDRAVLQCIYALSVPVRVGIAFVAQTQTLNWSAQHALCNLECALFLAHWLRSIASSMEAAGLDSVRPDEQKLLNMVVSLVKETELAHIVEVPRHEASTVRQLAAATVRLWASTFKGSQVFEIVHKIGTSLYKVADTLDTM